MIQSPSNTVYLVSIGSITRQLFRKCQRMLREKMIEFAIFQRSTVFLRDLWFDNKKYRTNALKTQIIHENSLFQQQIIIKRQLEMYFQAMCGKKNSWKKKRGPSYFLCKPCTDCVIFVINRSIAGVTQRVISLEQKDQFEKFKVCCIHKTPFFKMLPKMSMTLF